MSNRARRLAATVSGALLTASLALAACGRGAPAPPVTAGAAPGDSPAAAGPPAPPTLPPVQQRDPDLFDGRGCARTGPDAASCASTAADIDRAAASPGPGQRLAGYVGGAYSTAAPTGTVVVLDTSVAVATAPDGHWSANGLVRNQRSDVIGVATVHADLVSADGSVLESVAAAALVHPLRPGEPAPFTLTATSTPAASVASVRWSADAGAGATDVSARDVELQTYWTRRPTDPKRIDNYLYHDPSSGPDGLVVFGSVTNLGAASVAHPRVLAAWSDADGRVVLIRDVPLSVSTGSPATDVGAGGADDFLFAVPSGALPPGVDLAAPMLWGYGA